MTIPRDLSEREADALASMMGADARRIDGLVGDVGEIKGDMRTLKADTARTVSGIEQLQLSMAAVGRHTVMVENQNAKLDALHAKHDALDSRVRTVELDMPQLKEARNLGVRGVLLVLSIVGLAVLALVIKR